MKLAIEITRQDYYDYCKFYYFKTKLARFVITRIALLIVLEYLFYGTDKKEFNLTTVCISSALYIGLYCIVLYRTLNKTRDIPKDDGTILGQKEFEFTEDEIISKSKNATSQIKWTAIKSLEETKKAFYLFLDTNMGIAIPKRFFQTEADQQACKEYIQERLTAVS